jgi:nitroreductase
MMNEPFEESWRIRFATEPPENFAALASFGRHRSVRRYRDEAIPESWVQTLIGTAQSASTSSNLQLWSVISIQDPGTREEIAKLADNYQHIRSASWFFAFLADHYRLRQAAASVGEAAEGLDYSEFYTMAVIDAALAAERFVCAAETLGLGTCYIGAMRNNAPGIKQILDLPEGVFCVFGLCLGWPEEPTPEHVKPRLRQEAIWFKETYNREPPIEEYNSRMKDFYDREKMKGDINWSMRSGRRADNHHLTGREILKPWLEEQGFNRR